MILAEVSASLFLAGLVLILIANVCGYFITRYYFRRQDRLHERVTERAARKAVELAVKSLHGDDDTCDPTRS